MESMKDAPVAIITSGGGMKCAYSAGALVALAKELGLASPDIFVAASGSVGSMFYYLTGQYEDIQKAWTRYLPSPAFIRYTPLPAMRINYLVDTVFKEYMPLDIDALEATSTRYFVPITDTETGSTDFISNETWFNPYEVMRAAKAIPVLYNGHVRLGGRSYLDGDFSVSLMALIQKALAHGARRILFITNSSHPNGLAKLALRAYARFLHPQLRASFLKDLEADESIVWPPGLEFVTVTPSFPLPAYLFTRERRKIIETFNMGYDDVLGKRDEIAKLFAGSSVAAQSLV